MNVLLVAAVLSASLVLATSPAQAKNTTVPGAPTVPGATSVYLAGGGGRFDVVTSVPRSSTFGNHGGAGVSAPCKYHQLSSLDGDDDGEPDGDVIGTSMQWVYEELPEPTPPTIDHVYVAGWGAFSTDLPETRPLAEHSRRFRVGCRGPLDPAKPNDGWVTDFTRHRVVDVPVTDPLLDPNQYLDVLHNQLQLIEPAVHDDAVVGEWGGLVVRSPLWLAIDAGAWVPQRSNTEHYPGWDLTLHARPARLDFTIVFKPETPDDGPAWTGTLPCIGDRHRPDNTAQPYPPRPSDLADYSATTGDIGQLCVWVPPADGTATITATVTYNMLLETQLFATTLPDDTWQSPPTTYTTGELVILNATTP